MPQLVLLAVIGTGAYAGYRWLRRTAEQMAANMKAAEVEIRERQGAKGAKDLGQLEFDPTTGQYRPAQRD